MRGKLARLLGLTIGASLAAACSTWLLWGAGASAQTSAAVLAVPANVAPHPPPAQPIPYSHRTHVALGLQCETCHTQPDRGPEMGFPATEICMGCHVSIAADRPAIRSLADFASSATAIPWARVYRVLPGVTWSHDAHLTAGIACGACHGDVASADTTAMTTSVTAMASCIGCHQSHGASDSCATCHAWPAE
jgi:hypothetical protein